MPYEYECLHCDARSPHRHDNQKDAEDERLEHRATAHGGLAPRAGDRIRQVHAEARGDGVLPDGWVWAGLFLLALVLANCWGR